MPSLSALSRDPRAGGVLLLVMGTAGGAWSIDALLRARAPTVELACDQWTALRTAGPTVRLRGCRVELLAALRTFEAGELVGAWLPVPSQDPELVVHLDDPPLLELLSAGTQAEADGPLSLGAWTESHAAALRPTIDLHGELLRGWRRGGEARAQAAALGAPTAPVLRLGKPPSEARAQGGIAVSVSTLLLGILGLRRQRWSIERGRARDAAPTGGQAPPNTVDVTAGDLPP